MFEAKDRVETYTYHVNDFVRWDDPIPDVIDAFTAPTAGVRRVNVKQTVKNRKANKAARAARRTRRK